MEDLEIVQRGKETTVKFEDGSELLLDDVPVIYVRQLVMQLFAMYWELDGRRKGLELQNKELKDSVAFWKSIANKPYKLQWKDVLLVIFFVLGIVKFIEILQFATVAWRPQ